MCSFDGVRRGNYFGGEPTGKAAAEARVGKIKNGKASGKDEITGEIIKGGGDREVDWIWRLCNMPFESDVVAKYWGSAGIIPLYKDKGERTECKNYRGICFLSVAGKIYAGILVGRVCRVAGGLLDDEQRGFRAGKGLSRSNLYSKVDR